MMKLSKENYNLYRKKTLEEIAFESNGEFYILEIALKTLILVYVNNHPKPKKHLMESIICQTTKHSGEWFRALSNSEYPLEPIYSGKKIKIEKFLDDQVNLNIIRSSDINSKI
jgi:hypothetical protein